MPKNRSISCSTNVKTTGALTVSSIVMSRLDSNDKNIRCSQPTKKTNITRCLLIQRSILHSVQSRTSLCYQAMPAVPQAQSVPPAHVCAGCAPGSRANLPNFWHQPDPDYRLVQVREHRPGSPVKLLTQTAAGGSTLGGKKTEHPCHTI